LNVRSALFLAFLAVGTALLPIWGTPYLIGIAFNLMMWIALVQSWSMLSATTGYVSLGHVVFVGIGAYAFVPTHDILPLPLGLAVSAIAAAFFAFFVGLPVLRVPGPYFVILTFGLSELVRNIVMRIESGLGSFGRMIFDAPDPGVLLWWMLVLAVFATVIAQLIRGARFGRGLAAIREDEVAAETVGVAVSRLKLYAWIASAAIPGAVGALSLLRVSYFEPGQAFDPVISFTIVTMALVGGTQDARGPILGAAAFVLLSELLWSSLPQLYMIVLGVALIVFILFLPGGLIGLADRKRRSG